MESVKERRASRVAHSAQGGRRRCSRCGGAEEFGVTVDLSRFYSDERAQVLTRACGARRVRWLLARLARALALPPRVALLAGAGGRLLPPRDPLRLLRPPDLRQLQLIPLPEHWHGQEGLRGSRFVHSIDDTDAPAPEVDCSNRTTTNDPLHRDSEKRPEPDMQMEHTHFPESESQMNASLELQRVKQRALELLDRSTLPAAAAPAPARRPRVRPRRRRRRAPTAASADAASPPPPASTASPPVHHPPVRHSSPPTRARAPSVQRNRSPRAASTPRFVRALC